MVTSALKTIGVHFNAFTVIRAGASCHMGEAPKRHTATGSSFQLNGYPFNHGLVATCNRTINPGSVPLLDPASAVGTLVAPLPDTTRAHSADSNPGTTTTSPPFGLCPTLCTLVAPRFGGDAPVAPGRTPAGTELSPSWRLRGCFFLDDNICLCSACGPVPHRVCPCGTPLGRGRPCGTR